MFWHQGILSIVASFPLSIEVNSKYSKSVIKFANVVKEMLKKKC